MAEPESQLFRSDLPWHEERADHLVVHCSDFRYHQHFDAFMRKHLGLTEADRIVVPGGPHVLLPLSFAPKWAWFGKRGLEFLIERHALSRATLIAHEGCSWYRHVVIGGRSIVNLKERQISDLARTAQWMRQTFSIEVSSYLARPTGGTVEFITV